MTCGSVAINMAVTTKRRKIVQHARPVTERKIQSHPGGIRSESKNESLGAENKRWKQIQSQGRANKNTKVNRRRMPKLKGGKPHAAEIGVGYVYTTKAPRSIIT